MCSALTPTPLCARASFITCLQRFNNDFVIDLVCYRLHGHNEADNAMFTQPRMYQLIERMTPVVDKYRKQLIDEGVIDDAWVVARETEYDALCDEKYKLGSQADRSMPPPLFAFHPACTKWIGKYIYRC